MSFKKAFFLILTFEILISLLAINNYGLTLEALQATTRFSGRVSLGIFSILFILLPQNRENLSALLSSKPLHIFAIAHGIHLLELLSYVYISKTELIPIRLAGGFLAYLFIFIMPMLQQYVEVGRLTLKKYTRTENIYLYYVWFIFFMSYLPRVQGKLPNAGGNYVEWVILLCWVCVLMGMKLSLMFTRKRLTT